MAKTIKQILELIKNPHYTLSQDEVEVLNDYRNTQLPKRVIPTIPKQMNRVQKHGTEQDIEVSDESY